MGVDFTEASDQEAAQASWWGMAAFQGSFLIAVPLGHAEEHILASAKHSVAALAQALDQGIVFEACFQIRPRR